MNKTFLSVIKYIIILGIATGLLLLAFRGVDVKKTIYEIQHAKMFWVFVSVVASLVAFLSRAIRWNILIEPLGFKPSVKNTSAALMVGYIANLAIPRIGEITRCAMLNRAEKVPLEPLIGTVIVERIIDVICLLLCILFVTFTEYSRLGNFMTQSIFDPASEKFHSILNSPLILISLASILIVLVFLFVRKKNSTTGFSSRLSKIIKGVVNGINSVRTLKNPLGFIFHSVLIWFMYFLMSYTCFQALDATAALDWHAGLFLLVVGGMGMSAPVPGGIGAYHFLVAQGLLLYGVANDHGVSFATLMHGSQTIVVIILGAISFLYLSLKNRKANEQLS